MGAFSDAVESFEECCKLIGQNKANKSTMALILTDALIDMYSHSYLKRKIHELHRSISICKNLPDCTDRTNRMKAALDSAKSSCNNFNERFEWLQKNESVSGPMVASIKRLHEYRNQYLHRLKQNENDSIAYAKLYLYLFQQLFIKIPINCLSSSDYEHCVIVKKALENHKMSFSTEEFRCELVRLVNEEYDMVFSCDKFLELLSRFLLDKYEYIIESMHFIIDAHTDKEKACKLLENDCKTGKIEIKFYGDVDDIQFSVSSSKTQQLLGRIRRISKSENEHQGLQTFVEIYDYISKFEKPVLELASDVDAYIQYQIDVMRGK